MTTTDTTTPATIPPHVSRALDQRGSITIAEGATLHRQSPNSNGHDALRVAFEALAKCESDQREVDDQVRELRHAFTRAPDHGKRLAQLEARAAALEDEHARLRAPARVACLGALEAAAIRAGAKYRNIAEELAAAAAELEALGTLRDAWLGTSSFDPLGMWSHMALFAPAPVYRPPGWVVVPDAYGRATYWHAASAGHAAAVRQHQAAFRAELEPATCGASFPF